MRMEFSKIFGTMGKGMGVRPTQLTVYAFLSECPNHALHPING